MNMSEKLKTNLSMTPRKQSSNKVSKILIPRLNQSLSLSLRPSLSMSQPV